MTVGKFITTFLFPHEDVMIKSMDRQIKTDIITLCTKHGREVIQKYKDKKVLSIFSGRYIDKGRETSYICIIIE